MKRVMTLSIAGALLLGVAPGCSTSDGDVDLVASMDRSAGIEQAVAEGRLTVDSAVLTEPLNVAPATLASYESLVSDKAAAPEGKPFMMVEHKASAKPHAEVLPSDAFSLTLDTPKSDFIIGEPVIVRATLKNVTDEPLEIAPLLDTVFDRFQVTVTTPQGPKAFRAMVQACTLPTLSVRTLQPGETFTNDLRLVAPKGGWMFDLAGDYVVNASLKGMTDAGGLVVSEPMELTVLEGTPQDRAIADMIMNSQAALLLEWRDSDDLTRGQQTLETIFRTYPDSVHALYAGHVLGNIWATDFYRTSGTRAADPAKAIGFLKPTFERLIADGAPVVAWDVVAEVTNLLSDSQIALGQRAAARSTLEGFIGAFGSDPNLAQAIDGAREKLAAL